MLVLKFLRKYVHKYRSIDSIPSCHICDNLIIKIWDYYDKLTIRVENITLVLTIIDNLGIFGVMIVIFHKPHTRKSKNIMDEFDQLSILIYQDQNDMMCELTNNIIHNNLSKKTKCIKNFKYDKSNIDKLFRYVGRIEDFTLFD